MIRHLYVTWVALACLAVGIGTPFVVSSYQALRRPAPAEQGPAPDGIAGRDDPTTGGQRVPHPYVPTHVPVPVPSPAPAGAERRDDGTPRTVPHVAQSATSTTVAPSPTGTVTATPTPADTHTTPVPTITVPSP